MEIVIEKIDKDGYISIKVTDGNNYISYFSDDYNDLHLVSGTVNNVRIRKNRDSNKYSNVIWEKDGRKGKTEWCNEDVKKINTFTLENYLQAIKDYKQTMKS